MYACSPQLFFFPPVPPPYPVTGFFFSLPLEACSLFEVAPFIGRLFFFSVLVFLCKCLPLFHSVCLTDVLGLCIPFFPTDARALVDALLFCFFPGANRRVSLFPPIAFFFFPPFCSISMLAMHIYFLYGNYFSALLPFPFLVFSNHDLESYSFKACLFSIVGLIQFIG